MEDNRLEMLANMAKMDKQIAEVEKHKKKRTRGANVPKVITAAPAEQVASPIDYNKLVTGRFRYLESPGATLKFSYDGVPYEIPDGTIRKLPLKVAMHLNDCYYTVSEKRLAEDGRNPHSDIHKKVDRFAFENIDFMSEAKLFGPKPRLYEIGS